MRKIAQNTLLLSGSQILGRIIGFLYYVFLARVLPVAEFGIYAWVLGYVYNFYPLADFGLERLTLRDLARKPKESQPYLSQLLPLRFLLGLGALLLALIILIVLGVERRILIYAFVFGLSLPLSNLVFIYLFVRNAQELMLEYALVTVLIPLLAAVFGFLFVYLKVSFLWFYLTFPLSLVLILVSLFWQAKRKGWRFGWRIKLGFWRRLLGESWALAVLSTGAVFYLRTPLILVGLFLGNWWAGIYASASRFVEAGILLPAAVSLALFPISSRLLAYNKEKMKVVYLRAVAFLFLSSLPVFLIMFFGAPFIIPLIYGERYFEAVPIFSLMGVLMIFYFVNSLAGNVIQNSKKVRAFLPFALLNLLVTVIAGLFLIPEFGAIGGVWAAILGEVYGLVVNNFFVWRILEGKDED